MKYSIRGLAVLALMAAMVPSAYAEVLGRISDESEPAATDADTPQQGNDRRIIYRVICDPGGERLPDCERPFGDTESLEKPPIPPETEAAEVDASTEVEPPVQQKTKAKAQSAKKKTGKKTKKPKSSSTRRKSK